MYRWIDADGVVNYAQTPPPEGFVETPLPHDPRVAPARAPDAPERLAPAPPAGPWEAAMDAGLEALAAGRLPDAAHHFREALRETARLPPADPRHAVTLDRLSAAYLAEERFALAEPLLRRWLARALPALGAEHPLVGEIDARLGTALMGLRKHGPAEPWLRQALAIAERSVGPEHPQAVVRALLLARLLSERRRWAEAEPLHRRAVAALDKGGPGDGLSDALVALGRFYEAQRRWDDAETRYRQALAMRELDVGADHPDVATLLDALARVLRAAGRPGEAVSLEARARALRAAAAPAR